MEVNMPLSIHASVNQSQPTLLPTIFGDAMTPAQTLMVKKCTLGFRFVISMGGIWANLLNIRTFYRMGLKDGVTIIFFNLAISDLMILIAAFAYSVNQICDILKLDHGFFFELDPYIIATLLTLFGRNFNEVTAFLTAFLAVQRCHCVAMPLHFKRVFTKTRTFIITGIIWTFCLACSATMFSQFEINKIKDLETNSTTLAMSLKPTFHKLAIFYRIVLGIFFNFTCQSIVLICVCVLANVLRRSVQFRQTTSNSNAISDKALKVIPETIDSNQVKTAIIKESSDIKTSIGSKERQATLQVALVSSIFLITSAPFWITAIAELVVPGLELFGRYHNTFNAIYTIRPATENINSAVNFFVYYKYNPRYKQLCFTNGSN